MSVAGGSDNCNLFLRHPRNRLYFGPRLFRRSFTRLAPEFSKRVLLLPNQSYISDVLNPHRESDGPLNTVHFRLPTFILRCARSPTVESKRNMRLTVLKVDHAWKNSLNTRTTEGGHLTPFGFRRPALLVFSAVDNADCMTFDHLRKRTNSLNF